VRYGKYKDPARSRKKQMVFGHPISTAIATSTGL